MCKNLQPNKHFECIIDTPLGSGQSSNHDNTERKPTGEETPQTKLLNSLKKGKKKID